MEKFVNVDEASAFLGVGKGTLYVWAERGKIPSYKFGRKRAFKLSELNAYAEKCKQPMITRIKNRWA